jgi:hypothetical protein
MAQRRDDVECDTKHDVALSATISTPVFAAIHHRIVGAKSMFATESVHSQIVAVPTTGSEQKEAPYMGLSRNIYGVIAIHGVIAQRVLGTTAETSRHVPSMVTA